MDHPSPLRITADTNVCDILHKPDRRTEIMAEADARELRQRIQNGQVVAFVSEASVFIECLSFEDKLTYLAVAGTKNARPQPDPRRVAVFEDMASLGMKMLHAPLIAAEKFIHDMSWADDVVYSAHDRQERFGSFAQLYSRHEPLEAYGENLRSAQASARDRNGFPLPGYANWRRALKTAWDDADEDGKKALRRELGPMISEWGDVLILASHHGYGNDIFCTADEGKGSGSQSALHHLNRAKLKSQGIDVLGPNELLTKLSGRKGT
jgi:hypothetical protein